MSSFRSISTLFRIFLVAGILLSAATLGASAVRTSGIAPALTAGTSHSGTAGTTAPEFAASTVSIAPALTASPGRTASATDAPFSTATAQYPLRSVRTYPQMQYRNFTSVSGSVILSPENDGVEEIPGVGVTVTLVTSKNDTLYTTVGDKGTFIIYRIPAGRTYIRFSMLGYKDEAKWVNLVQGENKVIANLKPGKYEISSATVREQVNPISLKGDTIVFNAAAAKTVKGDMAIDIIEQMPGVEVSENSISVLNEKVENVYIDGALLFGDAPMKALNNLPSEEVLTIKSYQEYANKDPHHKISKNETKQRVLDIQTKNKPKFVINLDTAAGAGFDTDSTYRKFRYTLGANAMASSETLQASVSANLNNINDASVRIRGARFSGLTFQGLADYRIGTVALEVNRKWMSSTTRNYVLGSVGARYQYTDSYNISESITQRIYFPTEDYDSRTYESSSRSATGNKLHSVSVNARKSLKDGSIFAFVSLNASDGNSSFDNSSFNRQDDLPKQGTESRSKSNSDDLTWSASLKADKGFRNKLRLSANASFSHTGTESTSGKIDNTTSTITTTVLDIEGLSSGHNYSLGASARYELSESSSLVAGYNFSDRYNQSRQYAYDVTDPENPVLDGVNTQLRTNDNNVHTGNLKFITTLFKDKVILDAGVRFLSEGLNRGDSFPVEEPVYSRRFNSIAPEIILNNKSQLNRWFFSFSSNNIVPSIEQLRPRIDNSNLYSVSVGNPDLRQGIQYQTDFSFSTVLGRDAREDAAGEQKGLQVITGRNGKTISVNNPNKFPTFSVSAFFTTVEDVLVDRRTYFAAETYLPEYNYTMPAQSTLLTYENADRSIAARARVSLGLPLKFIGGVLNSSLSVNWDKSPSYVNSILTKTENFRPMLSLRYMSTFSRKLMLSFSGNASWVHSSNSAKDATQYFTESLRASVEINSILRYGYLSANYYKTFIQGISLNNVSDNILNLGIGARFGPRNNYDVLLQVHDLFNRDSGFSTSMGSDFITNSWKRNFGRYLMLRFSYRFNQLGKKGRP